MEDALRLSAARRLGKVYRLIRYSEMRHTACATGDDVPDVLKEAREELDAALKEIGEWFSEYDARQRGGK